MNERHWAVNPRTRGIIGGAMVVLGLLLLSIIVYRAVIRAELRHVAIHVSDVSDKAKISVDCEGLGLIEADNDSRDVDIGWVEPDVHIAVAAKNSAGETLRAAFTVTSNGERVDSPSIGIEEAAAVRETRVGLAEAVTADGTILGQAGCEPESQVDHQRVADYVRLPSELRPKGPADADFEFDPPTSDVKDAADKAGPAALLLLFVLGILSAQIVAWRNGWLAEGRLRLVLSLLSASLAMATVFALPSDLVRAIVVWSGAALFFAAAGVLLLAPLAHLLCPAANVSRTKTGGSGRA